jgi:hypothetical protein
MQKLPNIEGTLKKDLGDETGVQMRSTRSGTGTKKKPEAALKSCMINQRMSLGHAGEPRDRKVWLWRDVAASIAM